MGVGGERGRELKVERWGDNLGICKMLGIGILNVIDFYFFNFSPLTLKIKFENKVKVFK